MQDERQRVRAMSFNIRVDTPVDAPEHTWERRRDSAADVVRTYDPDVVGVQEALPAQLADLLSALPRYRSVGRGREAGGRGESVPILYQHTRWRAADSGDFWLSETPEVEGSIGWDARDPRLCTWAVLEARRTGHRFLMLNTHLDRRGREARRRGAALIVETIARLPRLPCIVTGDLNAGDRAAPFNILRAASLRDTYRDVFRGRAPATVHHYDMRRAGLRTRIRGRAPKIDFVLCDRSWRVASADIVRETPFGCWPSDHYPVAAELELVVARSVTQTSEAKGAMGPTTAPPRAKG